MLVWCPTRCCAPRLDRKGKIASRIFLFFMQICNTANTTNRQKKSEQWRARQRRWPGRRRGGYHSRTAGGVAFRRGPSTTLVCAAQVRWKAECVRIGYHRKARRVMPSSAMLALLCMEFSPAFIGGVLWRPIVVRSFDTGETGFGRKRLLLSCIPSPPSLLLWWLVLNALARVSPSMIYGPSWLV